MLIKTAFGTSPGDSGTNRFLPYLKARDLMLSQLLHPILTGLTIHLTHEEDSDHAPSAQRCQMRFPPILPSEVI